MIFPSFSGWIDKRDLLDFRQFFKEKSKSKVGELLDAIDEALEECLDKEEVSFIFLRKKNFPTFFQAP